MKNKQPLAKSLSLEEKRLKIRTKVSAWRKNNPEKAKVHYRRWALKIKGTNFKPRNRGAYYGAFDHNFEKKQPKHSGGS